MQPKHTAARMVLAVLVVFATVSVLPALAGSGQSSISRGVFYASDQALGEDAGNAVAVGDLDGDLDLDAVFAGQIWLNDGRGRFNAKAQQPELPAFVFEIALADVDSDDDLDLLMARPGSREIWLNDGEAAFANSNQTLGNSGSWALATGDVDDDDDVDVIFTNSGDDSSHELYLNDGSGIFTAAGQDLGSSGYRAVALADVDGNGSLDAFFADCSLFINDGNAVFAFQEGSPCGPSDPVTLAMGDVDGDMDVDAIIGNATRNGNLVMLNDGAGSFSNSGQMLGAFSTEQVTLADVDVDGDLDLFSGNTTEMGGDPADQIWLNDGQGVFTDSGQTLGDTDSAGAVFGDVDEDGDPDLLVGTVGGANKLYVNGRFGVFLPISLGA